MHPVAVKICYIVIRDQIELNPAPDTETNTFTDRTGSGVVSLIISRKDP